MNKLTKEQAEWLIGKMKYNFQDYSKECRLPNWGEIAKVIDECIEKEFPTFEYDSTSDEDDCYLAVYYVDGELRLFIESGLYIRVTPHIFKQFTEGCQKICEWMKE